MLNHARGTANCLSLNYPYTVAYCHWFTAYWTFTHIYRPLFFIYMALSVDTALYPLHISGKFELTKLTANGGGTAFPHLATCADLG